MPKSFTESERNYIKTRLLEEAKDCLGRYGMKKTTVDELVKRVNIPKGTFYLFYETKELLFFDVLLKYHDELQNKLIERIEAIKEGINPATLTELIYELYKAVEDSFLLNFITSGDMELLLRKLPPETAGDHAIKDNLQVDRLFSLVPEMNSKKAEVFSAALRGIFLSMLHKHEIGADVFDYALKVMIHGVVIQMFGGGKI